MFILNPFGIFDFINGQIITFHILEHCNPTNIHQGPGQSVDDKKDLEESEVKNPDDENKQNEPKATGTKNKTGGKYGGNSGWG